jgi:nucleotide-binding universal stress UspA family protein
MSAGAGLEQVGAAREADLIVVGSCHHGIVGRVLVGDDAASVLHHAQRPVAIAPTGFQSQVSPVRTVGVAYDGSEESEMARTAGESLADGLGAELIIRCVATPHVFASGFAAGAGYIEDPADVISRTRAKLGELEGGRQVDVAVGIPNLELVAFSEAVDLLVCGSRHSGPVRRVALGSTSDYLAHHARCPLIVTPRPSQTESAEVGRSSAAAV